MHTVQITFILIGLFVAHTVVHINVMVNFRSATDVMNQCSGLGLPEQRLLVRKFAV